MRDSFYFDHIRSINVPTQHSKSKFQNQVQSPVKFSLKKTEKKEWTEKIRRKNRK